MRRREFFALIGGAMAAWPLGALAQQAGKVYRVGLIFTTSPVSEMAGPDAIHPVARAFVHAMRDLGYVEGQNLVLERRSAEGKFERFGEIVTELVRRKADVIVTTSNEAALEAKRVTSAMPIVMAISTDPVAAGIVASLARPGGNVTGFTRHAGPEFEAKRLQLLKEAVPEATRVAFLGLMSEWEAPEGTSVRAAAQMLGVTLVHTEYTPTHFADAFSRITQDRPHALFVMRSGAAYANRQLIAAFVVEQRMPSIFPFREYVEAGGLMSYGVNLPDLFHRAAGHVDKILKGAKPADLPVQQPTKFDFAINLKAAKALGLTLPPPILLQATEMIE